MSEERWWDRAACRGRASLMLRQQQPSTWFDHDSEKRRIQAALALCARCPVQQQCLADAKAGWRLIGKQVGDVVGGVLSDEIGEKYGKGPGDGSRQRRKYLAIVKDINSLP